MKTCGFCKVPCHNDWCPSNDQSIKNSEDCFKDNKALENTLQELIDLFQELTEYTENHGILKKED